MDYIVVRPTKQHNYAIMGTFALTDRVFDDDLKRGAYVPLSDIQGLHDDFVTGLSFYDYVMKHLDLLVNERIPILRYAGKEWRVWIPAQIAGRVRLAEFAKDLENFMLDYCSISDRQKIILEADEALYRLTEVVEMDAHTIKSTTWKYLQEEEEAGRCNLYGWEKLNDLAEAFLLRRLFPKFNQTEFSNPVILDDIRAVFKMILLTRMLKEQKTLVARYDKDISQVQDIEALVDYYFPNPIKPR